jgi:hypothetical protein
LARRGGEKKIVPAPINLGDGETGVDGAQKFCSTVFPRGAKTRTRDKQAVKPRIVTPWVVFGKAHGAFESLGG